MHNYLTQATLLFALAAPAAGLTGCCAREGAAAEGFDAARYVNPFIGASTSTAAAGVYHGLGKTFPGATTPFGMVQARTPSRAATTAPDTVTNTPRSKASPSRR